MSHNFIKKYILEYISWTADENIKGIFTGSQFLDEFLTIVDSQMHFHKNFVHAASASLQLEGFFLFIYLRPMN